MPSQEAEVVSKEKGIKGEALLAELDSMVDRTVQILELTSKEDEYIESIGTSVRAILNMLQISLPVAPSVFHDDIPQIKSVLLNKNCEIMIMQNNGNVIVKHFNDLEAAQVFQIMKEIIPSLNKSADVMKSQVTERISLLKKMSKQLQRAQTNVGANAEDEDDEEEPKEKGK